jgi:hypothetical protein
MIIEGVTGFEPALYHDHNVALYQLSYTPLCPSLSSLRDGNMTGVSDALGRTRALLDRYRDHGWIRTSNCHVLDFGLSGPSVYTDSLRAAFRCNPFLSYSGHPFGNCIRLLLHDHVGAVISGYPSPLTLSHSMTLKATMLTMSRRELIWSVFPCGIGKRFPTISPQV